jgi:hypothetical protein
LTKLGVIEAGVAEGAIGLSDNEHNQKQKEKEDNKRDSYYSSNPHHDNQRGKVAEAILIQ